MRKLHLQNLLYLLICVACAVALSFMLTKSSPNSLVAVLCTFVTVLCVQIALMRHELSSLKEQLSSEKES